MKPTQLYSAIFLFQVILIGCTGSNPADQDGIPESPDAIPIAIGALWTYETHDNLAESVDTVKVSVVDTVTTGDGSSFSIWEYRRRDEILTRYVSVAGDTLVIRRDTLNQQPCEFLVFPLAVGRRWASPCGHLDSSCVTESGRVSVPAGEFDGGARIDRSWDIDVEGGGNRSTTWIVPEVGIVSRQFRSEFSDGSATIVTKDEEWKMLCYDLGTLEAECLPDKDFPHTDAP